MQRFVKKLLEFLRTFVFTLGLLFGLLLLFGFTHLPFNVYHWLGTSLSKIDTAPRYIVLLGGGGMPSESSLMRIYFAEMAAAKFPKAKIVVSIPGDLDDEKSTPVLVREELVKRGVSKDRILFENEGTNTRSQALNLRFFQQESFSDTPVLLVTSPEHMRRSVLTFKKAGFLSISALPAFEDALEADLLFKDDELGGNRLLAPDVGGSIVIRYQFWNHLKYEVLIAREMVAMGYYKLRGWI